MAQVRVRRRLAAILAADVVGYSRLMGLDEEGTLAALTDHIGELLEPSITAHGGRVVKTTGDGLLAEFASVVDAVRCAVACQVEMRARNAGTPSDRRIAFRIGVNLGDVISQNGDLYGDGVNIAARLESLAEPGGICISGTAFDHVQGKLDAEFADLGRQMVKNIAQPIRAYRVAVPGAAKARPPGRKRQRRLIALAAATVMIVVGAGLAAVIGLWDSKTESGERREASAIATDKPSIAVLPFTNISEDKKQDYFADGISEDIIVELSKSSGLLVIARNSSFSYRGEAPDVRKIARELGVRYVLSGSVRREKDRVRVNAELIDAAIAVHIWAEKFDRRIEDIFAVQDEITEGIIVTLVAEVTRAEIARVRRKPPATFAAYDNYLRGMELFRARATRPPWGKTLSDSRKFLNLAIQQDPRFSLAYSMLAENFVSAWIQPPFYAPAEKEHQNPATLIKALTLAQRAVELDPGLAEGHAKMGWVLHWMRRPDEAQSAYRRAFQINPNLLDDAYPNALIKFGRNDEAIRYLKRQIRVDPAFGRNYGNLGLAYYLQRKYPMAVDSLKTCKRLATGWRACSIWMAAALAQMGRLEEAKAEAALVHKRTPKFSITRWVSFEPYSRQADIDHLTDGLRKAGFPQ